MKQITTLALLLASTSIAMADDGKPAPTDPKLAQLVGHWEGTTEFEMAGKTSKWSVTISCERATVGPAILCMNVAISGDQRLDESWMFGYDAHTDLFHLFMTNDWGEAYDHSAKWTDASAVSFVHKGTRDGKPLVEDYTLSLKGEQMIWRGALKVGGKTKADATTTLKRVK